MSEWIASNGCSRTSPHIALPRIDGTFMWLMEEVGELATALRNGTHEERLGEFADVLAWLTTIANVAGVDLSEAVARKYGSGCPGCGQFVCTCADAEKP